MFFNLISLVCFEGNQFVLCGIQQHFIEKLISGKGLDGVLSQLVRVTHVRD